ncbi:MAG: hypothetical protein K1W20_00125 [Lachnospiraceae bacterium]|nr:hypothetical protein [Lachnospiraceae bacterium]
MLGCDLDTKDLKLYNKQEIKANCFAAQLLMPEQILLELQHRKKGQMYHS